MAASNFGARMAAARASKSKVKAAPVAKATVKASKGKLPAGIARAVAGKKSSKASSKIAKKGK